METVWQVEVTKKPMDEKNDLKMMEMDSQVYKMHYLDFIVLFSIILET